MIARVWIFIISLLVISVAPLPAWTRLPLGCLSYLLVVLPAIAKGARRD